MVPPSDIARTKPLMRLVLNQIGRRLTESLDTDRLRQKLLLMLDEFAALGRLDFFESQLAFMAGYGIRSFLITQSLNQLERAYGPNHAILDNCHIRIAFSTNDERTGERAPFEETEDRASSKRRRDARSNSRGRLQTVDAGDIERFEHLDERFSDHGDAGVNQKHDVFGDRCELRLDGIAIGGQ